MIQIKVPCKPYVKSYIHTHYPGEVVHLNNVRSCVIQHNLLDILTRPKRYVNPTRFLPEQYNENVRFSVTPALAHVAGFDVTPDKIMAFNRFVDICIRERLILVTHMLYGQIPIDEIILQYMQHNGLLEAGMPFDTLKKVYYRHRNNRSNIIVNKVLPPSFVLSNAIQSA